MISCRRLRIPRLSAMAAVLAVLSLGCWLWRRDRVPQTYASTPTTREGLRSLQQRVQEASQKVMPAVVAIALPPLPTSSSTSENPHRGLPYCSGIIITKDGLILSQFHVSHRFPGYDGRGPQKYRKAGDRTTVIFMDGRKREAELLGADQTFDLSLLRLVEPGPYPYVPLDSSTSVELGSWVLKLGHPQGYHRDRPPVVRLGRVLFKNRDIFVTDCLTTGGDSGGPYFDLEGRLVGIIASSVVPAKLDGPPNYSFPPRLISSTTNQFIQHRMAWMLRREIPPFDEQAYQSSYEACRRSDESILPSDQWTQGVATAATFQEVTRNSRASVVTILDEAGRDVVLGTVVAEDGRILTIAGRLPAEPRCRLLDGRVVSADVIGIDPAFDLALLQVKGGDPRPVHWSEGPPPVAGTILAAVGLSKPPLAIGVVSVPHRDLPGPFPTHVARRGAEPPVVTGKPTAQGYLVESVAFGKAMEAGLRPGDVILKFAGRSIRDDQDVLGCVSGRVEGEWVPLCILRGGQRTDLTMEMAAEPRNWVDYPSQFEHDMPLLPGQCGGPVVDLDGAVVGVTIRRGQYGCIAVPGDCLRQLLPVLKTSSISGKWTKPPPASVSNPELH